MQLQIRTLLPIPVVIFLFSAGILFYNFYTSGEFVHRDIDLKGGTLVTIETGKPVNTHLLETEIAKSYGSVFVSGIRTSSGYGARIEVASDTDSTKLLNDVRALGIEISSFSVESVGSALGEQFLTQVVYFLVAAFVLMSVVVFIVYRKLITSFGIVFASLSNIITTLAITSLLGIKISFAGFAGLLMLIAYTVDTNIVLTTKVVRSTTGEFKVKYRRALITGLTLIATISLTMLVVLLFSSSKLLVNVAEILLVGFVSDLPFTWILNAGMLEMYIRRRGV